MADRIDTLLFAYRARGGVEDVTLTTSVADRIDTLLFAYRVSRGVEDVTLTTSVADRIDTLLFAYRARGGVEDATPTLVDLTASHSDKAGTSVRVLFHGYVRCFSNYSASCFDTETFMLRRKF